MKKLSTFSATKTGLITKVLFVLLIFATAITIAKATITIPLNDPKIYYDGVTSTTIDVNGDSVIFNRFTPASYAAGELAYPFYAKLRNTQSGIRIRFQTASDHIYMEFSKLIAANGHFVIATPTNGFTVFVNGAELISFSTLSFTITHPEPGVSKIFEVTLPNIWSVNFQGLQLDDTYTLDDPGVNTKPGYAAFGHSVPHGTGQYVSTARTYPFQLAQCKGWNLYNFAVAGLTMESGWQMAYNVKNKDIDYITIDYGYNDWQAGRSLVSVKAIYETFVDSLRRFQPAAKIYCLAPSTTTTTTTNPYTVDQLRNMISEVVLTRQAAGDNDLHVIDGSQISTTAMLAPWGDPVHFSESGAGLFASNLCGIIDDENDILPLAIKKNIDFSTSHISVSKLTSSEIILKVSTPGNYFITIFSIDGRVLYSSDKRRYFHEGIQEVLWNSSGTTGADACIVKVSDSTSFYSVLLLKE